MSHTLQSSAILALAVTALASPGHARALQSSRPADQGIRSHIVESLLFDPRIDSANVLVEVKGGYVTLTGTVRSLAAKEFAVSEAEKIAGVIGVLDKLVVDVPWRPDEDIRQDVRHRIVNNSRIHSEGIEVLCNDGQVRLSGSVGALVEKKLAVELASETRGVRKVTNEITVRFETTKPDAEVLGDVKSALDLNVYLVGLPIRPTVKDGQVKLQGSVGSWYAKRLAEDAVQWIPGVHGVLNELEVAWVENQGARVAAPAVADEALAERVTTQLRRDSRLDPRSIEVKSLAGGVTLYGSVPSTYQRGVALEDAKDTVGVGWVTDKLVVGALARSDSAIRADVALELDLDYLLSDTDLGVRDPEWHGVHLGRESGRGADRLRHPGRRARLQPPAPRGVSVPVG